MELGACEPVVRLVLGAIGSAVGRIGCFAGIWELEKESSMLSLDLESYFGRFAVFVLFE